MPPNSQGSPIGLLVLKTGRRVTRGIWSIEGALKQG